MREKRKRERGKDRKREDERKEEHEKFMKKSDGNFNFKSGARVKIYITAL